MIEYLLIDPALTSPFLKLGNENGTLNKVLLLQPSSNNFYNQLDELLRNLSTDLSSVEFFLNFGPGSYTGLKQSKILAEVFQGYGSKVHVFKQDNLLGVCRKGIRAFLSPAYKGELYVTLRGDHDFLEHSLISLSEWGDFCQKNNITASNVLSVSSQVKGVVESEVFYTLAECYGALTFNQLKKISNEYDGQELSYYRVVTDDYKATFNS